MRNQSRLMSLRATGDHRCDHGNADAAAQVAKQVEQPRCVAHLLFTQEAHGRGGQRHKSDRQTRSLDQIGHDKAAFGYVQVNVTHRECGDSGQDGSDNDEFAAVNLAGQIKACRVLLEGKTVAT